MSFILQLPAELVHHIGGHMLVTYHQTLRRLSQSCTFLQANLHDRLVEAHEILLLHAWKKEWKNALKHASVDDMMILERHQKLECIHFPDLLIACLEVGNIDVLKYILMARKIYEKKGEIFPLFIQTCYHGYLTLAQWVALQFKLTAHDVRMDDNYALHWSCRNGHLQIAQWLTHQFKLTARDARMDNNRALRWSCAHGHLDVAQWLTQQFGLTAEDARADDNFALSSSCGLGHLEVARWLTVHFGLTADDARAEDNYAFRSSCANGHSEVARWLTQHFGLTAEDAQ